MRFFLLTILFCIAAVCATAQVNVAGKVIDKEMNEALVGASVIVKGSDGKIKKFATSKSDGSFSITVPSVASCRLEVSMMGYARKSVALDSVRFPLTVFLEPGAIQLKEVAVKADRIREQGDTVTYNVGTFAQEQDRSIGDVLKRMPGIDVEKSGKIKYQGEDINKFYIEGSDLLGGKYGVATNGINHEDVGAVEVMENHQPMQVLSGISFSDKAAINLKLKNKAKATWSFHGDAGAGYGRQPDGPRWDGELFAMAVMPSFQNITTFKTNNTGEDLSLNTTDFFSSRRSTGLSRYIGLSLPSVPSLDARRTLFNRSAIVSTSSLWKLKGGELKAQIDYSFNRVTADATNITTYFKTGSGDSPAPDRVITENRTGVDRCHSLSGKLTYELNHRTAFVNNTLKTNIDWDDMRLGVTGSLPNAQTASLPDYYVSNNLKIIKRFNSHASGSGRGMGTHLVTFQSDNQWESLPQTLSVAMDGTSVSQRVGDHAFHTNESAAYAFSLMGVTVSLEGGLKAYFRTMNSDCLGDFDFISRDDGMHNVINTDCFTAYAVPKLEYWIRKVDLTFNAPLSFARYTFDKALANRSEFYFSPSLSMTWKPNNRFSMSLRGGLGRSPMNLNLIHPALIMTDYRSLRRGVDDFYNSSSRNVSARISYKHTRHGVFADAFVMQSWSHLPYTMAQQLYGDYIVYSYSPAESDGKNLMVSGKVGKTLDFMRGSANITGSFNRSESNLISDMRDVNSVTDSWSVGASLGGAPFSWLSIDYRIDYSSGRISMNGIPASWLGSMENELLLNIMPHRKWEWHISGEYYRNELSSDVFKNVALLDTKVVFKPSKRIELSALLNNIFNKLTYNYITYNQLSSFESQRRLRGRELLLSITLRK